MVLPSTTVTPVAAVPPIVTVAPELKLVPVIVTLVPPATGPEFGATVATVGARPRFVNSLVWVPLCVSALVTVTSTMPAVCAGVVAVIVVLLTTVTPVAAVPPIVTVAPAAKPVPVIVRAVPPLIEPDGGDTLVTAGAGAT